MVYFAEYCCTLRDTRARAQRGEGGKNVDANLRPSSNCAATMRVKTAVGIKYSVGITLPWLKVTVGNKCREQSRGSATFQLINVSRRLKPRHYFISDSPLRRNFIPVLAARLATRDEQKPILGAIVFHDRNGIYISVGMEARDASVMLSSRNHTTRIDNSCAIRILYFTLIRRAIRHERISIMSSHKMAANILFGNMLIFICTQPNTINIETR